MANRIFPKSGNAGQRIIAPWRGSTLQFIVAVILPLTVLLVVISFWSFSVHQNAMRTLVGDRDQRSVQASANSIETEIHRRLSTVQNLARLASASPSQNLEAFLASSGNLLESFNAGAAFFDQKGNLLAHTGDTDFWESLNSKSMASIELRNSKEGTQFILVSASTADGMLAAGAFSPDDLLRQTIQDNFPPDGQTAVYVIDSGYRIIYQSGPRIIEGEPANHPGVAQAFDGKSGATYVRAGNDEHVVAYSRILPLDWAIISEESWETVTNPTLQTSQIIPLVLIPALLLAALALWFGAEQIVKPLQALEAKAAKLAWGKFEEIEGPVHGIAEIRHLQTELIHMARQLQAAEQSLHSYIGAITKGQEEERLRLARDLHDDTIQALIALKQRVQLARLAPAKDGSPVVLAELESLAEQTIEDLRRTTRALRPIYLEDLGLVAALEMLASETGQNARLRVDFHHVGAERRLAADVELALYRMAQEALNNTVRHAQATHASVKIEFKPQSVTLHVADNGTGFDVPKSPAEFVPGGHFGLVGLYERAQLIGAHLEIISATGKGTRLNILLPSLADSPEK